MSEEKEYTAYFSTEKVVRFEVECRHFANEIEMILQPDTRPSYLHTKGEFEFYCPDCNHTIKIYMKED